LAEQLMKSATAARRAQSGRRAATPRKPGMSAGRALAVVGRAPVRSRNQSWQLAQTPLEGKVSTGLLNPILTCPPWNPRGGGGGGGPGGGKKIITINEDHLHQFRQKRAAVEDVSVCVPGKVLMGRLIASSHNASMAVQSSHIRTPHFQRKGSDQPARWDHWVAIGADGQMVKEFPLEAPSHKANSGGGEVLNRHCHATRCYRRKLQVTRLRKTCAWHRFRFLLPRRF